MQQKQNKNNEHKRNIKQIAYINYLLKLKGLSQQAIAKDLKITRQSVNRVILGYSNSSRVKKWLYDNLGVKYERN